MPIKAFQRIAIVLLTIAGATASGYAQDAVAQFYRGKTVTIMAGLPAGGSYDAYARLLARYLGKHLPGEPSVIVSNMPGAGSNIAAAYVAHVAEKDGTYIAAPDATQPLYPILGELSRLRGK
jgi:tripartite-type tricarboxylate transporter receptor subunit TctC